jgi:hypothetical protein
MLLERLGIPVFYLISVARVPSVIGAQEKKVEEEQQQLNGEARSAWLFQSNPVLYDVRGALRALKEQVWSISRYAKEIKIGDRVYIWEAGRRGGIVGLAEVSEPAHLQAEPPEQLPFAKDAEAFAGNRFRAKLRILRIIEPLITRQAILSYQELASLDVLRCSRGTNFRLSQEETEVLDDLTGKTAR